MPDFIIIGGQKCGTTSLHQILAQHPDVFIPEREIFYFDVDDRQEHPDFFVRTRQGWTFHDWDDDHELYTRWYHNHFVPAQPGQLVGEDSTTYLSSTVAPARIARALPEVKLLAMLRDPVERAYSHYWHTVHNGRATMSFERTLRHRPGNLLRRGHYREHLERYRGFLEQGRLQIFFLEEMASDTQGVLDRVCAYLGLSALDTRELRTQHNAAAPPLSPGARLLANRVRGLFGGGKYNRRIPNMPGYREQSAAELQAQSAKERRGNLALERLRLRKHYPPMAADTRDYLRRYYARQNEGLEALLGRPLPPGWP